ncbi:putative polysaccharide biosynthesis protein [Pseudalkalibacillus caeni]|uniref:Polysaccharide biosynthesis protein n=1 Tax=Exobacillus caeni TaxID=2574798 RepID=A0A5R9FBK0_9BACL|nr:polysaccharide biosynthesis protein [Pseudalkalibacillus caeni]TLS39048.1 polysaccharide biosynthesis protein [Pseudalkalibacillus caeni]
MSDSRLVRGTLLLTSATLISRILGLVYFFPFLWLVGKQGAALYQYAYTPYTILLSISTMGVPLAVSKFVSKYNALGDYHTGRRLFKSGLLLMSLTGLVAFLALFSFAGPIAKLIIDNKATTGNTLADVTMVIRVVSTALVIVPSMSLIRGYFQGFQSMGPTAVSQLVEQIVRIVFILAGSFIVIKVLKDEIAVASGVATFGAFIGALGGLAVLVWYWKKRKAHLDEQLEQSTVDHQIPLKDMYKELIAYAVPFVVVGLAIPIYLQIDTFTINNALRDIGYELEDAEAVYAILTAHSHKLIMIPVSLATAMALTLIPTITNSYTSGDNDELHGQITQTFQLLLFLTLPAAIGLSVLAAPAFGSLYGLDDIELGSRILRWYAPTAIFFALFSVTAAILQGINKQKFAVISLLVGVVLKGSLTYFFIVNYEELGPILTTDIGYLASVIINLYIIKKYSGYSYGYIAKRALLIGIFVIAMAISVWLVRMPIEAFIAGGYNKGGSYLQAILSLIAGVVTGGAVYLWLSYRSHLAGQILGNRFKFLKRKKNAI